MKNIVITGGPCAGKSTALELLNDRIMVPHNFIPEVATEILKTGAFGNPDIWGDTDRQEFQTVVYRTQVLWEKGARNHRLNIFDRGTLDGAAYLGGYEAWAEKVGACSLKEEYARYTHVFFLHSLAKTNPDLFLENQKSNPQRIKVAVEQARAENELTRETWKMHPRFREFYDIHMLTYAILELQVYDNWEA